MFGYSDKLITFLITITLAQLFETYVSLINAYPSATSYSRYKMSLPFVTEKI